MAATGMRDLRARSARAVSIAVAVALAAFVMAFVSTEVSTAAVPCDPAFNAFQNPGFETGALAPWVALGTNPTPTVSSDEAQSGSDSALLGDVSGPEALGDSSMYQQFTVPEGGMSELSFSYLPSSTDTITFDWQDVYITDTSGAILAVLMHVDETSPTWLTKTVDLTAWEGQTVRIEFLVHEDGFGDDTAMYVDDLCLSPETRTLTVTRSGTGSGTVTSSPAGIACGSTCSSLFAINSTVNLTATPAAGSSFAGWSGACAGAGSCSVPISTAASTVAVGATFTAIPPPAPPPPPLPPPSQPPDTTLESSKINQKNNSATFRFKAVGNATGFQCSLRKSGKKAKFAACTSPKAYRHLKSGKYTFEVRALDGTIPDATPAKKKFKVD